MHESKHCAYYSTGNNHDRCRLGDCWAKRQGGHHDRHDDAGDYADKYGHHAVSSIQIT